jgi:hypothetical protein
MKNRNKKKKPEADSGFFENAEAFSFIKKEYHPWYENSIAFYMDNYHASFLRPSINLYISLFIQ